MGPNVRWNSIIVLNRSWNSERLLGLSSGDAWRVLRCCSSGKGKAKEIPTSKTAITMICCCNNKRKEHQRNCWVILWFTIVIWNLQISCWIIWITRQLLVESTWSTPGYSWSIWVSAPSFILFWPTDQLNFTFAMRRRGTTAKIFQVNDVEAKCVMMNQSHQRTNSLFTI